MTRPTHLREMIMIRPMTVIIDVKNAKIRNIKKKDPVRLCTTLTENLLTTAYKSKMISFKMDEDPLQCRIYFLTFIDSLDMIFSQYRETCEVLLDYPKIGGDNVKNYAKQAIRNLLHANRDVHIRRLISEFPIDGIKCIEKLQSHCANMTFANNSRYDRPFQQVTHKGGNQLSITLRGFRMHRFCQFQ